jgi:O-antigen ligase
VIITFVVDLLPSLSDIANLRGANQFGLFTGRQFIWGAFWDYFSQASVSQIIFGNGLVGQATAGISYGYSIMFGLWPAETRVQVPLHNSYLQTMADMGLIGLCALMALLYTATYRAALLGRMDRPEAGSWRGIALGIVALSTVAASEVALTVYMKEAAAIIVVLVGSVAWFGGRTGDARK